MNILIVDDHEEYYRTVIRTAQDGFWLVDTSGQLLDVNESYCHLTGYSREQLLAMHVSDIEAVDSREHIKQRIEKVIAVGFDRFETRHRCSDGRTVEIEMSVNYTPRNGGRFFAFIRDITERKRAEGEIRLMQTVTQAVSAAGDYYSALDVVLRKICETTGWSCGEVWMPNSDGSLLECAPVWYCSVGDLEGFGKASSRFTFAPGIGLPGRVWSSKQPEWTQDVAQDPNFPRVEVATQFGLKAGIGIPVLADNEVVAVMDFFAFDLRPEDDRFIRLVSAVAAQMGLLFQRKQAEEAFRESEEQFRTLFENTPVGIGVADIQGNILMFNDAMLAPGGYSREEIMQIGNVIALYHDPEQRKTALSLFQKQGFIRDFEVELKRKDGTTYNVLLSLRHTTFKGKPALQATLQDMTERRKLEEQLHQAQKMESLGRLAGGVSHDYNNMLNVIIGYSELALTSLDPADPLYDYLLEILNAGERSRDITRQLLAFARQEIIAPKLLDLNDTVHNMFKILRKLIGEDIDLAWLPKADLWPVLMDPSQIDQILANLCVNARDAIAGVGKIIIETDTASFNSFFCFNHKGVLPGDFVLLSISDDGCGMDRETRERIFEPFFTTKGVGRGTGLGLATVYGIVNQNNGFINVYSEPGKGTTFKIYLPRHLGDITEDSREAAVKPQMGKGETLLVVEDEVSILKLAETILSALNYKVLTAKMPSEALQLAAAHAGEIALLITDVVMPEMNGRELAEQMQARYPKLRCLYMSGYTADIISRRVMLSKGFQFIQKPFTTQDMAAKVRAVLDESD